MSERTRIEANEARRRVPGEAMESHLCDDRRASVSPWCVGNSKLGLNVFTYSKAPGRDRTCPGATEFCESVCYAMRIMDNPHLRIIYEANEKRGADLPDLPAEARLVRGHVSGDFDSAEYVRAWIDLVRRRPDATFWFYTRSWRIAEIRPALEELRALPNVEVWASMDPRCEDPPEGWRVAWIDSDARLWRDPGVAGKSYYYHGRRVPVCPEQTGERENCEACGYCFRGKAGDLVFLEH